ncbi:Chitinase [Purpureocillium lavendulum]|uniref:Chitinase n=1 Tax=Purpureocillium lavendulum TaxID=1247861 RepID=A0AB34FI92_9HYPO|nr:Chitinase [Purpureocillium lavendulum]
MAETLSRDTAQPSSHEASQGHWIPTWHTDQWYNVGDRCEFWDSIYQCNKAHKSQSDWEPPLVPDLWKKTGSTHPGLPEAKRWMPGHAYGMGDRVYYHWKLYQCIQPHNSQPDWEPNRYPALWKLVR